MACGCVKRMRKYVLPFFGYELHGDVWQLDGADDIPDADLVDHYSRLTAKIVAEHGLNKLRELFRPSRINVLEIKQ